MKAALALARRDLVRWFTNPTGYVFITVFIALCAAAQFLQPRFFLDNLANLAPLNDYFPYILIFFAPAIAMGTWAEERRHGTDELLLTLPVTDAGLVAGKYFAAVGVYLVSLAFSLAFVVVLGFLGSPDVGLAFGTYLGYALIGAALIAVAMIGSMAVDSVTVGFVLGAVLVAVPVVLGDADFIVGEAVASVGVREAFRDLTSGVVSLFAVLYFAGLAVFGLAANLYFIRGRRMRAGAWHLLARLACLVVSVAALGILAERSGARADVTAERLHSLAPLTRETLAAIPEDKPVFIQAYVSPQVPREYVEMRANLLGILREIDALGGGRVHVRVSEATRVSDAAREADDRFGIKPVPMSGGEGRAAQMDVFLAVAVTSGLDEAVLPFFHQGLAPEYEITRSIRAVMNAKRARVGIAATEASWLEGYNFQTRQQTPPWEIVGELKRQYEVVKVPVDGPITEALDVLIVPMVSSLKPPQLDAVAAYVKQGKPTLLLDDPFPGVNPRIGPNENDRQMAMMGGRPPEPKGDSRSFYRDLGLHWNSSDIVWDKYAPHPWLRTYPEVVFAGPGNGSPEAFNRKSPVTARLQEIVFILGGCFEPAKVEGIEVTPLVRAGNGGGVVSYTNVMHPMFGLNPNRRHYPTALPDGPILAARMHGKAGGVSVDAIAIADIDFISGEFFEIRRNREWQRVKLDNIAFFLNAVDALARDEAMIGLRTRRPRHRTLEAVEKATRDFEKAQLEAANTAAKTAETELSDVQSRFEKAVGEIAARTDIDQQTKEIQAASVSKAESMKMEAAKRRIEDGKAAAIAKSEDDRDRRVEGIRNEIRLMALLMTPLPAIVIGLVVLALRIRRELEARR